MKTATRPLPVIHVSGTKTSATKEPRLAADIQVMDLFVKVIDNAGPLRSRVDSFEVRLRYLETLLEGRGIR